MEPAITLLANQLIEKNLTIAFAESATAGRLCSEFSLVKNAGKFLKGGLACYDASLKEELLKVPKELIEKCTPESPEVTKAIADGLCHLIHTDIAVGITGLCDSGGSESPEKPVGTMFAHGNFRGEQLFAARKVFTGTPREVIDQPVEWVITLILESLNNIEN